MYSYVPSCRRRQRALALEAFEVPHTVRSSCDDACSLQRYVPSVWEGSLASRVYSQVLLAQALHAALALEDAV